MALVIHGACGRQFPGNDTTSHCPACHETFSSQAMLEKHRAGNYPRRFCVPPDTVFRKDGEAVFRADLHDWGTLWADPRRRPEGSWVR